IGLRVVDAGVLDRSGQGVALLERKLVIRVAFGFGRLVTRFGLLLGRILPRVGRDAIHLGVGLGLRQVGVRLLHANVLGVARHVVAFQLGDIMVRLGARDARIFMRLRRVLVCRLGVGLGSLLSALGLRGTEVLGVAGSR